MPLFAWGSLKNAFFMRGLESATFLNGGLEKLAKFHPPSQFSNGIALSEILSVTYLIYG